MPASMRIVGSTKTCSRKREHATRRRAPLLQSRAGCPGAASPGRRWSDSTCMCWRNRPVATRTPCCVATRRRTSHTATSASSGAAAATKLGRRPLRQSPSSVNWLTTSIAPPTSASARFILPSLVVEDPQPDDLVGQLTAASSAVSSAATPNSTTSPRTDLAADFVVDGDLGLADALHASSHGHDDRRSRCAGDGNSSIELAWPNRCGLVLAVRRRRYWRVCRRVRDASRSLLLADLLADLRRGVAGRRLGAARGAADAPPHANRHQLRLRRRCWASACCTCCRTASRRCDRSTRRCCGCWPAFCSCSFWSGSFTSIITMRPKTTRPIGAPRARDAHARPRSCGRSRSRTSAREVSRFSWGGVAIGLTLHGLIDGVAMAAAVMAERSTAVLLGRAGRLSGGRAAQAVRFAHDRHADGRRRAAHRDRGTAQRGLRAGHAAGRRAVLRGLSDRRPDRSRLGQTLGFAAGAFICIATSDLLPELQFHRHDRAALSISG